MTHLDSLEAPSKPEVTSALETIVRYIETGSLEDDARESINKVLGSYDEQFKQFVVAVTRDRIGNFANVLSYANRMEAELFKSESIAEMSPGQKVRALSLAHASMDKTINMVNLSLTLNQVKQVEVTNHIFMQNNVQLVSIPESARNLSKDGRENVRNILGSMMSRLNTTTLNIDE